ncbi:hypothetical protein GTY54_20495, partial [Streptomyces sp. SID625]|nr:hypothetical protein [Streptomyces sp. SID625]
MTAPHSRAASAGRDLRLLRAAVFAAVCVVLAATGHTLGSCATVPLWTLGAGFLGVLVVVVPLAGRARSLPGIAALLAAGQLVLHALFGLGQHGAGMVSGAIPMGSTGSMGAMGPLGSTASAGPGGSLGHAGHVLSDAALVERAARYLCGTTTAGITPARAYRILVDAHVYPSGAAAPTGPAAVPHDAGSLAALLPSLPMLLGHVLAALAAGWLL